MGTESFVWNLDPEIINIYGPFGLRWYSLMFLIGFLLGYQLFTSFCRHENKPISLREPYLYYLVFGTILGARLGHCLFYDPVYFLSHPWEIIKTWEGGLASHGGYLGILVSTYIFGRVYRVPFFWLADRLTILAIGTGGFIRLGNFFNSEIIGKPSDLPWAVIFSRVDSIPRHPTQLYESLGYFTIAFLLYLIYRIYKRTPPSGQLLGMAMIMGFGFRFFIERFKENQEAFEKDLLFNMGQLLSIPFVLVGIILALGWHLRLQSFKEKGVTGNFQGEGGLEGRGNRRPPRNKQQKLL